ncbi:3-keto-5-aminohexanoate cleavage protein [Bacillus sp. EB600]|uniref:3-keto-5-aminohexanoate cleavage protein n=1 Tax=Bacillus sp. EB600 TaxID=2806345 RepID=UPI002108729F|nr:3-keto-5-aminohexanoate cleavage protein [Bacillus sp. EB600]
MFKGKVIITAALTGALIAHLHMIDENGQGTMDIKRFKQKVESVKEKGCDIILNLTTSGELNATDEIRIAHLIELKPEVATFGADR